MYPPPDSNCKVMFVMFFCVAFPPCVPTVPATTWAIRGCPGNASGTPPGVCQCRRICAAGDALCRFRSRFAFFVVWWDKVGTERVARFCLFRRKTDRFWSGRHARVCVIWSPPTARSRQNLVFSKGPDKLGRSV